MKEELGPYRIIRKIAVGGMAEIYLARQRGIEGLERTVVLKQILERHESNEEFVTMFLDEARLLAALSHPNIAQVFDLGREGETHFLVMEYVRGPTLGAMLSAAQKAGLQGLPETPALGIALAIAEALHYVHECRDELGRPLGIVHRDLNPANVVVSYDGAVKLIDFGIAKAATKVYETRTGVIKGTYGYIAPEALTGTAPVDRRADVFALGILLYEMLVGKHPFDVSDEPNLLDRILEARYKRPKEVRPDLPSALDRLIARCLTPHPEGRPESVQSLIDELVAHMAERGIVPTGHDRAELARQLVEDQEGPAPLRRLTSMKARPVFPRDGRDGTQRIPSSIPPDDSPTQRAPILVDGAPPAERPDSTRRVSVPRVSEVPEEPTIDSAAPVAPVRAPFAASAPVALASAQIAPSADFDEDPATIPAAPSAADPSDPDFDDDSATIAAPRPPEIMEPPRISAVPMPVLSMRAAASPETTLRMRATPPRRAALHPALGVVGLLAAGTLAFIAARALGGAPEGDPQAGVMPPSAPSLGASADRVAAPLRSLHIVSEPPGASIMIDGIDVVAQTPAVIAVDPRVPVIYVGVTLEGYAAESRQVSSSIAEARFVLTPNVIVDAGVTSDTERRPRRRLRRGRRQLR